MSRDSVVDPHCAVRAIAFRCVAAGVCANDAPSRPCRGVRKVSDNTGREFPYVPLDLSYCMIRMKRVKLVRLNALNADHAVVTQRCWCYFVKLVDSDLRHILVLASAD